MPRRLPRKPCCYPVVTRRPDEAPTCTRRNRHQSKTALSCFPPVHRVDLEGKQRVEGGREMRDGRGVCLSRHSGRGGFLKISLYGYCLGGWRPHRACANPEYEVGIKIAVWWG